MLSTIVSTQKQRLPYAKANIFLRKRDFRITKQNNKLNEMAMGFIRKNHKNFTPKTGPTSIPITTGVQKRQNRPNGLGRVCSTNLTKEKALFAGECNGKKG